MANPYQIEDGESMASVRSKLNQMGEAVDGAASKEYVDDKVPTGGTTGQVLTKTDTGTEWKDAKGKEIFYVERYAPQIGLPDTTYAEAKQAHNAGYELVYRYNGTASSIEYRLISVDNDMYPIFYFGDFQNSKICKFASGGRTFYNLVTSSSITQISKVDSKPTSPSSNTLYVITE